MTPVGITLQKSMGDKQDIEVEAESRQDLNKAQRNSSSHAASPDTPALTDGTRYGTWKMWCAIFNNNVNAISRT